MENVTENFSKLFDRRSKSFVVSLLVYAGTRLLDSTAPLFQTIFKDNKPISLALEPLRVKNIRKSSFSTDKAEL